MSPYLNFVFSRIASNEEVVRTFTEIENKLLSVLRPIDLMKVLLGELQTKFNIPYTSFTLIHGSDLASLQPFIEKDVQLQHQVHFCEPKVFELLHITGTKAVLLNDNLWPVLTALSFERTPEIRSVAIIPIHLKGEFVGTLNLGDTHKERFQPEFDTSQLEQLIYRFSLCLSNGILFENMEYLAYHDELTGFLNQRGMNIELSHHVLHQYQTKKSPLLTLLLIDIANLRSLNEEYGYVAVDGLIRHFADQLYRLSRKSDVLCRYNSDKFVWILPKTTMERTDQLVQKMHKQLTQSPFLYEGNRLFLTVNVGVAPMCAGENPLTVFEKANEALENQKKKRQAKILSFPTG